MEWTEERVARLRELWEEGLSARQIAEGLGGITRNAVIGKANRMGLSKPTKSSMTRKQNRQEVKPVLAPPVTGGATILQLSSNSCRWPLGDPGDENFRYCGAPASQSAPYCEYHARLAYQPASSRDSKKRSA